MRNVRLFVTDSVTRSVSTGSSKLRHQDETELVVISVRPSASPAAGTYSPTDVRFVVGRPASGSGSSGISAFGCS